MIIEPPKETFPKSPDDFGKWVRSIQNMNSYIRSPQAFGIGIARASKGEDGELHFLDTTFRTVNFRCSEGTAVVMAISLDVDFLETGVYVPSKSTWQNMLSLFACFRGDGQKHDNIEAIREVLGYYGDDWGEDDLVESPAGSVEVLDFEDLARPVQGLPGHFDVPVIAVISDLDDEPVSMPDAFLRLHLLSLRHVKPHGVNMTGVFGKLNNVFWSTDGPIDPKLVSNIRWHRRRHGGYLTAQAVDKFPRLVDYVSIEDMVLPEGVDTRKGVCIADGSRVRLGAYLGDGTTVMHEGFVNFNAGTEGPNMVEGRISAGVMVGADSDLGGGCSTMGTLSGGGTQVITVGRRCLVGANAGIGISLGDDCTVEAGLYLTAGMLVYDTFDKRRVKATILSGKDALLFRRNSNTGVVEALPNIGAVVLNDELHSN